MKKTGFVFFCVAALVVLAAGTPSSNGFPTYSQNRDATNCRLCHGDFLVDNYISNTDREGWGSLHNLHRRVMFDEDTPVSKCDPCHMGGGELRFPVFLSRSSSDYLDPIGCVGCHGRYEDMGNDSVSLGLGAGLRQHHTNAGVVSCVNCHADANPADFTPVGEDVLPPNYFTPDEIFMNKPTDPCNSFGEENYAGIWEGLDNDGDGVYDVLDSDCKPPFGKITICHYSSGKPAKTNAKSVDRASLASHLDGRRGHVGQPKPRRPGFGITISINAAALPAHLAHGDVPGACEDPFESADVVLGGRLYDQFWSEAGSQPTTDHPLWATRPDTTSNSRTGSTTWRCKECHGWDYRGVDGAYATGSHRTGFPGIYGTTLTPRQVLDVLADPAGHDYRSQGLTDRDLWNLVKFVIEGQTDTTALLLGDQFTGDPAAGQDAFENGIGGGDPGCAGCHAVDGMRTPPTTGTDPTFDEFPQVLAGDNPWEFQHKVRYGQPGTAMRGIMVFGGTAQQANDIGAHAQQNLP